MVISPSSNSSKTATPLAPVVSLVLPIVTVAPDNTASPSFTGGTISGTATATGDSCSISNSTNSSGISITATGVASRAAVVYNSAVSGWVEKSSNDNALSSVNDQNLTSTTYYINGVTLSAPSSGTRTFTVTTSDGVDSLTTTYLINSDGELYIDGSGEINELIQANGVIF